MELRAEEISQIIKEQITDYDKKVELSETGVVFVCQKRYLPYVWSGKSHGR